MGDPGFRNCSYFIFPLRIDDREKLDQHLAASDWRECRDGIKTSYLFRYVSDMNRTEDERLRVFEYETCERFPLYMFDSAVGESLNNHIKNSGFGRSGNQPTLTSIRFYVFRSGIAFLEYAIDYGQMNMDEIVEFVYLFRSLRFNESSEKWPFFPVGSKSIKTVSLELMPEDLSGTTLCFNIEAEVKQQANIFTIVYPGMCGEGGRKDLVDADEIGHWRYWLAHGYHEGFSFGEVRKPEDKPDPTPGGNRDYSDRYELIFNAGPQDFWGGSQDGMACVVQKPDSYRFSRLSNDYHFLYLLLLNQRFSSIAYLEEYSKPELDLDEIRDIHDRVVDLKTRYAFRVISDDYYFQTIYSTMCDILEMDHLLEDLEDANAQLIDKQQAEADKQQEAKKRREDYFGWLLGALSFLSLFSALIDLTDYIGSFGEGSRPHALISLAVNGLIVAVVAVILLYLFKHRKKP